MVVFTSSCLICRWRDFHEYDLLQGHVVGEGVKRRIRSDSADHSTMRSIQQQQQWRDEKYQPLLRSPQAQPQTGSTCIKTLVRTSSASISLPAIITLCDSCFSAKLEICSVATQASYISTAGSFGFCGFDQAAASGVLRLTLSPVASASDWDESFKF